MLRIAALICLLFAGLASAQIGPPPGLIGCTTAYVGPGDVQAYLILGGLRAYSRQTCGQPIAYVCDSTGGVDNGCADVVTSTTTGKLVPKVIGTNALNCGIDNSGNCTVKIIYNTPLNSTCPVRGANGVPGTCDAVQNTVANRYGLYNGALGVQLFSSGAAGAGYTLNSSITLTQPFSLYAIAYTNNTSATNTFIGVGNANIHFGTGSPGNVLNACDSGTATAVNPYINNAPSYLSTLIATCVGGVATLWQSPLANKYPYTAPTAPTQVSGGSTTASGVPVIGSTGASLVDLWEFGILQGVVPSLQTNVQAIHANACSFYGYTCLYSGPRDITPFKAYWGFRAYSGATTGTVVVTSSNRLVNVCSPSDTNCDDVGPNPTGSIANRTIGGELGQACYTTISSGTYNSGTGAVSLAINPPPTINPTLLASGNVFALNGLTGTGAFTPLNATIFTATTGTNSATLNFTGPTGLGAVTITGGYVLPCTVKTFYDTSGANFCTGGIPCDCTQATIASRAVYGAGGGAIFSGGTYLCPGTDTTNLPYSQVTVAKRVANPTSRQDVISAGAALGFTTSANTVEAYDGNSGFATGVANDNQFHSLVGENDSSNTRLYVDGMLLNTIAATTGVVQQPYSLSRSAIPLYGVFLEGGLTNTAISAADAAALSAQQQVVWGYTSGCGTAATTYLAALSGLSGTETTAYTTAICALASAGYLARMDGFYIHANANAANARVNAVNPSALPLTTNGSCTFTVDRGFTGDGASCYQSVAFNPSTYGGRYALNSASVGVCILNSRATVSPPYYFSYGAADGSNFTYFEPSNASSLGYTSLSSVSGDTFPSSGSQGDWVTSRAASTGWSVSLNGSNISTSSVVSSALVNANFIEMAFNNNGTTLYYTIDQHAVWWFGDDFNGTEIAAIHTIIHNLTTALGATGC